MQTPTQKERDRLTIGAAASLGLDFAVGMAIFAFGGYWLDRRQGTGEFWTLCGVFVGLLYGAYEVWKLVRQLDPRSTKKEKRP
jgi:ATP synthase protein I